MTLDELFKAVEDWQRQPSSRKPSLANLALFRADIPSLRRACQEHAERLRAFVGYYENCLHINADDAPNWSGLASNTADFLAGPTQS
jgi:hypothetical protein